ncbi:MAG: hypothetical protein AAFV98_16305 [Chloroflexota bacterium]
MALAHFLYFFGELIVGIICAGGVFAYHSYQEKRKSKRGDEQ